MLKLVAFGILCLAVMCNGKSVKPFGSSSLTLVNSTENIISPLALGGIQNCGVALLVDITLSGCSNAPCSVSAGSQYDLQVRFIPRDFHYDMHLRTIVLKDTQLVTLIDDEPVADSTVEPGKMYDFAYNFRVPTVFTGEAEFRLKMYQNYVHELCLVIPLNIS